MRDFLNGTVMAITVGISAVVLFPLLPIWTFAIWFTEGVDVLDAAADVFESYLKIIKIV